MCPERQETPDLLPPGMSQRNITIKVEAESLEGLRKFARSEQYGGFTLYSDEPASPGGKSDDPPPLVYFASSILF